MDVRPGQVFGRYTIESEIGRGGMGIVMLATDSVLDRRVALKMLLPGSLTREEIVARFFREARLSAQLTHPNTVHIYDLGEVDDVPFIAMEYVDGKPLTAYLGDALVPAEQRMRWLVDVAKGLAAAHARGLLHRDMKPSNVMVSKDGIAKVVDFGLAKRHLPRPTPREMPRVDAETPDSARATFQTATGFVVGTPAYMAPEQLEGLEVDASTDQFGWALTAYALMLGKNLRTHDPLLFGPIPLLCDRVPGVSRRASEIVLRALSNDRAMRFPSMDALVAELSASLAGTAGGSLDAAISPRPVAAIASIAPIAPVQGTERPPASNHPTPRMATAPLLPFCPECGISVAMSSPRCTGPHAAAFPMPPGAPEEPMP